MGRGTEPLRAARRAPHAGRRALVLLVPRRDVPVRPIPQVAALAVRDVRRLGFAVRVAPAAQLLAAAGPTPPAVAVPAPGRSVARPSRAGRRCGPVAGPGVAVRAVVPGRP